MKPDRQTVFTHHASRIRSWVPRSTLHAPRLRGSAFTLLELLLVIVIIASLAVLLLPVLSRGKLSAQRVTCVSNLRQLGLATHLYWDDNTGNCFRYDGALANYGRLYWFGWIGPGAEGERPFDETQGALYPYLRGRGLFLMQYYMTEVKIHPPGNRLTMSKVRRKPHLNGNGVCHGNGDDL